MKKPSKQATAAARQIWSKYERYLGAAHMGNQDPDACIETIAEIISAYCDGLPPHIEEALNSGDGVYRP